MPQVPTYDGPQVRSTALQPVFQREIDVSSGLKAAAGALTGIADVADKAVRRDAETEANTVDNEITAGWLQWDAENRRKFQGQNVGEYEAKATEWWDKAKTTYGANLSPLAQRAIGQTLGRKKTQALGSVASHVNAEKERFADDQGEKAAQSAIEFGVDTGDTVGAASQVRKIAAERGARKGWDTAMVQAEQQRLLGTLHLTVIDRLAQTDATKAQAYYTENKGEIPATAQSRVEQVLKGEGDNQFATQFAAQQAAKPLGEQLTAAADIKDPQRREKTLQQIRNNHAMVKAAQQEQEQGASDQAWQLVGKGQRVPERVLMQMNGRERVQLQEHLVDRSRVLAAGTSVKTDWPTYIAAREALASTDPEVRKAVNLTALSTKVAPAQLEQLLDLKTKTSDPKKAPEVATSEQQIGSFTRSMDLKGERVGQFQSAAYDLFNEHLKAKGKEPTYDERQVILDKLVSEIVIKPGYIWDTTGPAYTAPKVVRDKAIAGGKFTAGQVYTDAKGNRAKYVGNDKWEPIK